MATAPPTVTPLPDPPSRADPANFVARADAFLGALPDLQDDLDAVADNAYANAQAAQASAVASQASAVNSQASATLSAAQVPLATAQAVAAAASAASAVAAPSTSATSATSLTPGLGTKAFVTQSGKAFAAGQTLVARSASEPRQWMVGVVTSYVGASLSISVTMFGQAPAAGASADWTLTFWGAVPSAAKPGQVLRLNGSTPEWGDVSGKALQVLSAANLLTYSKDLTNPIWFGSGIVTPNALQCPDGTKTAQLLNGDKIQSCAAPAGLATFSGCYAPSYPGATALHRIFNAAGDAVWQVDFDPATGQIIAFGTSSSTISLNDAECGVESLGGGWWRLWVTAPVGTTAYGQCIGYLGAVGATDFQMRAGRHPGLYVPTTTVAASGAGARKRNQLAYGKAVDTNLAWGLGTNSVRVGKAVAPNGRLEATVYRQNSPDNTAGQFVTVETGTQYTASIWAKQLSGPDVAGTILAAKHDPGTGATFALAAFGGASAREWRRYSITYIHQGATISGEVFAISSLVGVDIAVWGAQVVKGPVPCNLIDSGATATDGQHADIEARRTHLVDTTYAAVDIAPPEGMQPGDWFEVIDVGGNAATNNIKVLRGGVALIDGLAEDFVIDLNKWSGRFTMDQEKGLVIT